MASGSVPASFFNVSGSTNGVANSLLIPTSVGPRSYTDYIFINNTLRVGFTDTPEGNPVYSTANIGLKDRGDGYFRDLFISNADLYMNISNSGFDPVRFVHADELEPVLNGDPVIFSNLYVSRVASNGYISFIEDHTQIGMTPNIGFRYFNGTMQFRNVGDASWFDIGASVDTFVDSIETLTTTSNLHIPDNTVGMRIRAVGSGGAGGSANTTIYSQGGGGGAGGYVEMVIRDVTLGGKYIQAVIGAGGSNTKVHVKTNAGDPAGPGNMYLDAYGGSVGQSFNPATYEANGGAGGSGYLIPGFDNKGYIVQGAPGHPGYYSENQNLRYYHGGAGANSPFGAGGAGAYIGSNAGVAGYGAGGGGGVYYNDGASATGLQIPSQGGNGIVLVEFYTVSPVSVSNVGLNFSALNDVFVDSNTVAKPYIKYGPTGLLNNVTLDITDDPAPGLGGILNSNGFNILFTQGKGVLDATGNLALEFYTANSGPAHLIVKSGVLEGGEAVAEITSNHSSGAASAGLYIHPKGTADIDLETDASASVNLTSGSLVLNTASLEMNSGYFKTHLAFYYSANLSTDSGTRTALANYDDTVVFQITGDDGRYWAKLDAGTQAQHMNIVYESIGTNNAVNLSFFNTGNGGATASVGVGTGLASQLVFDTPGQSVQMMYLSFEGPYDTANTNARSRWQVINTGAGVIV